MDKSNKVVKIFWIDDMLEWVDSAIYILDENADGKSTTLKIIKQSNGEDAVQELMMFDFDIIIMDFHMEPFNGDKYIADIREEEHLDGVPIVFYTQDPNVNLEDKLGQKRSNITCIYRPDLVDYISSKF